MRKYRDKIFTTIGISIVVFPILYILSVVFQDWYWRETIVTTITGIEEARPADGIWPYTIEWEENQVLLVRTTDGVFFATEPIWDKAYFGPAEITIIWREGKFWIVELKQDGVN